MAKIKVDLSGVKTFFFEKGDKLALVVCLATAGLLVGYGVLSGMSARTAPNTGGKSWGPAIKSEVETYEKKVRNGVEAPAPPAISYPNPTWITTKPSDEDFASLFYIGDMNNVKRLNPKVLAPHNRFDEKTRDVQMDYIRGTYFSYEVDHGRNEIWVVKDNAPAVAAVGVPPAKKKDLMAAKKEAVPTVVTRPVRMVVVHMNFPLREQLVEFQNAFRMRHPAEVAEKKEDLPRFLGINVWKTEVSGDKADWKQMVFYNPKTEKVELHSDTTRQILREAFYDDEGHIGNLTFPYLIQGLAMPLPKLAILPLEQNHYPAEVKVSGMDFDMEKGGATGPPGLQQKFPAGGPGGGGQGGQKPPIGGMPAAGAEVEFMAKPWRNANLPPEILAKLNDEIYVLDPFGINPDDPALAKNNPPPVGPNNVNPFAGGSPFASIKFWETFPFPPMPVAAAAPGGKAPPAPKIDPKLQMKPWDALIRFFDPDVKPGKTYKYMVSVRMANPNFGKSKDVAFPQLATIAELPPSPPVETPTITIPDEFELFAVDQKPEFPVKDGSDSAKPKSDQMVVQIHRWIDETNDLKNNMKQVIGDWTIAERLLVKRGHPVGRIVNVEVPVWHKDKNQFELGASLANVVRAKQPKQPPGARPPVFPPGMLVKVEIMGSGVPVDFAPTNPPPHLVDFDGGERVVRVGSSNYTDESASNLLILQADGKLIVRNTRIDSDPNSPAYALRVQRVEEWKKKTQPFRDNQAPPGGPGQPGLFPGLMQKKGG